MTRPLSSSVSRTAWRQLKTPHESTVRHLSESPSTSASVGTKDVAQDPQLKEWLVIIPDNEGVLKRRIQIRPKHSENFRRLHSEGYVSWAGPVFSQPCQRKSDVEDRPFMGSVMVVRDVSPANVYKRLSSDLFITEGIWNWEKAQVLPFNTLMRHPPATVSQIVSSTVKRSA